MPNAQRSLRAFWSPHAFSVSTTQSPALSMAGEPVRRGPRTSAQLAAWLLVIWDYANQKVRFAGFNYLVSTHIGLFVLVAAFMLMHSRTQSMDFASFATVLGQPGELRDAVFVLLALAFALKAAFFPMHTWLPRAHAAAPAHVSALMSGVIHKAGLYGLVRFILLIGRPDEWMGWFLIGFSLLSAVIGG